MKELIRPEVRQLNSLMNEINAAYHDAAVKLGLSDSVMNILYMLAVEGGMCAVSDIRKTGLSKQTANSALRRLEADSMIVLESAGGLRKNVRLTDAGRVLAEKTAMRIVEIESEIYDSWGEDELKAHVELNRRFLEQLKEKIKDL